MAKTKAEESFKDYLARLLQEELGHLDSNCGNAALAYILGTSPKTVWEWTRGVGPRAADARLRRLYLESVGRGVIQRVERELGRKR